MINLSFTIRQSLPTLWGVIILSFFIIAIESSVFLSHIRLYVPLTTLNLQLSSTVPALLPVVLSQASIHILLWVTLSIYIWLLSAVLIQRFMFLRARTLEVTLIFWGLTVGIIFCGNQFFFPQSVFAKLTQAFIPNYLAGLVWYAGLSILSCLSIFSLYTLLVKENKKLWLRLGILLLISLSYYYAPHLTTPILDSKKKQPNIIIVGIDSLRFDQIGFYQTRYPSSLTPHLDRFLSKSTHFTNSLTPLGRTFPAWMSILTGEYPRDHGARFDLINRDHLDFKRLLPKILQEKGYYTVFATDERRFSNIDEKFGFQKIIGPKMGYLDFFLSVLNDFPLSNLLVNTRMGSWLFPYNYINRASSSNYLPQTFTDKITQELNQRIHQPLFLAIHFCLPHVPYTWGNSISTNHSPIENYQIAIQEVDTQFQRLLTYLKQDKWLENTLVIILSDHGETLGLPSDELLKSQTYRSNHPSTFLNTKNYQQLNQADNHGTNVLSLNQHHVLLAMRYFGKRLNLAKKYDFPASLIDIKPTILDFVGISQSSNTHATSLYPALFSTSPAISFTHLKDRSRFIESGIIIEDLLKDIDHKPKNLMELGLFLYRLNTNTGMMEIKSELLPKLLAEKQRAIIQGNWLLALITIDKQLQPLLLNLTNGKWTDDLSSEFARQSPIHDLKAGLQHFYGEEIKGYKHAHFSS